MSCCGGAGGLDGPPSNPAKPLPDEIGDAVGRRSMLRAAAAFGGTGALVGAGRRVRAAPPAKQIQLAFCSQILCVPPYEVTRDAGYFQAEGVNVQLVYMRGSTAATQALVGGAVDYGATSFDDIVQAVNRGAAVKRFFTTGRLPLMALAIAPNRTSEISSFKDLEGRTVGVVSLGSIAHSLTLFLMRKAGADGTKARFAVLGPNIFEPVRLGQVDAAWVNEPALTELVKSGSRALVNFMETDDAEKFLGGAYEFMGVSVRTAEMVQRRDEMGAIARALEKGLRRLQDAPAKEITAALPRQLLAGVDTGELTEIFGRYRKALYPVRGALDVAACDRVVDTLKFTGLVKPDMMASQMLDFSVAGSV